MNTVFVFLVFGLLVMCISYIAYASNGIANKGLNIVGELFFKFIYDPLCKLNVF